jgi:hypothetical protein
MERIISEAMKLITSSIGNFDEELRKQISRGHELIALCLSKGDMKTAATMFGHLNRIGGMEKTQVDLTTGGNPLPAQIIVNLPAGTTPNTAPVLPESPQRLGLQ